MSAVLTVYGRGQVTLPKKFRDRYDSKHFIAEEMDGGLFLRPVENSSLVKFQDKDGEISLSFTPSISAEELLEHLQKANGAL